jgi:hypothetical protein
MKIEPAKCPECGEPAEGTLETVTGKALLLKNDDGTYDYAGETKIWWDEQRTVRDAEGRATAICSAGHEWQVTITYEGEKPPSLVTGARAARGE